MVDAREGLARRGILRNLVHQVGQVRVDAIDRALIDLLAIYRDVLMVQVGGDGELINTDLSDLVHTIAGESTPCQTLARVDHIETARRRLIANGNPLLVLEDMAISLRPQA